MSNKPILIGGKESNEIIEKLNTISSTLYVAGAGYKLLCVILGEADFLVNSSRTTFFWDTCACHAILRSIGGGIISLDDIINNQNYHLDLELAQIRYRAKIENNINNPKESYNHAKGLIAYRSKNMIQKIVQTLKQNEN